MISAGKTAFEADWKLKDSSVCATGDECFQLGNPSRAMVGTNAGSFYGSSYRSGGGGGAGCWIFLYQDSSGWHYVNGGCAQSTGYIPGPQDRVFVSGCANVRDAPGLSSHAVGCLANNTIVDVDSAPMYVDRHIWWHLANRGWMAHDFLVRPQGVP
jgi:hypothetical protein